MTPDLDKALAARRSAAQGNLASGAVFVALGVWFALSEGVRSIGPLWIGMGCVNVLQWWWARRSLAVAESAGVLPAELARGRLGWVLAGSAVLAVVVALLAHGLWQALALGWLALLLLAMAVWASPLCDRWTLQVPAGGQVAR